MKVSEKSMSVPMHTYDQMCVRLANLESRILALGEENNALRMTNEESQEIIAELSMALAIGCEEGLIPCVEPCKGHLGPKADKVCGEAWALWSAAEEIVAPLLPLFQERRAYRAERDASNAQMGAPPVMWPDTITLTAEFPVEPLRVLLKMKGERA